MSRQIRVGIVGASGYTGVELVRLLVRHPQVQVTCVAAKRAAGKRLTEVFGSLVGVLDLPITDGDPAHLAANCDVVFCALPHGESAAIVATLVASGLRVLDLSADYRLTDAADWATWYGSPEHPQHPAPALLAEAIYGLPELAGDADFGKARLVAVPGCYPTASLLAVVPLLRAGLVMPGSLIIDAKSGVSGAGRSPSLAAHFPEVAEGVRAYKVAGTHRHTAELEQQLSMAAGVPLRVLFTPHLVPMSRGIFACVYAAPTAKVDPPQAASQLHAAMVAAYRGHGFIDVLPLGAVPDTAHVRGSNRAAVAVAFDARTQRVLAMAAIDNLVKGAAGQAVQCMNLMFGVEPRSLGLDQVALFP